MFTPLTVSAAAVALVLCSPALCVDAEVVGVAKKNVGIGWREFLELL